MSSEVSSDDDDNQGLSRRTLLKGAAVGAGTLWVAPTVLTLTATPAAASAAGCLDCGTALAINGTGTSLTGWNPVGSSPAWDLSTGGRFAAVNGALGSVNVRDQVYPFSSACQARFADGSQPQAKLRVTGQLRGNEVNAVATFVIGFYGDAGATGTPISTTSLSTTSATITQAGPVVANVPLGTVALRLTVSLPHKAAAGAAGTNGQADNLTATLQGC